MTVEIPLTQGQVAIVCDCHAHLVTPYKWTANWDNKNATYRAMRNMRISIIKRRTTPMSRVIVGAKEGDIVDHINHDTLDNRCCNLRICTALQNAYNRQKPINNASGYIGVSLKKKTHAWVAQIQYQNKKIHLGYYPDAESAAHAYDEKAKELHGEFVVLNFPDAT